jgi:hypothetical protein
VIIARSDAKPLIEREGLAGVRRALAELIERSIDTTAEARPA